MLADAGPLAVLAAAPLAVMLADAMMLAPPQSLNWRLMRLYSHDDDVFYLFLQKQKIGAKLHIYL
jgi:hypothetical protein